MGADYCCKHFLPHISPYLSLNTVITLFLHQKFYSFVYNQTQIMSGFSFRFFFISPEMSFGTIFSLNLSYNWQIRVRFSYLAVRLFLLMIFEKILSSVFRYFIKGGILLEFYYPKWKKNLRNYKYFYTYYYKCFIYHP